jgi:putative toxin-antitoxin system antitoxin component (TIGR02293 family)
MNFAKVSLEKQLDKEVSILLKRFPTSQQKPGIAKVITYENFLSDKMLIITVIRNGIPYSLFSLIQHQAPFSESDWADFLDISTKSLHRYKLSSKLFKPYQSEKIIEMAEVTNVGLGVFGDIDKLKLWLNTPNYSLGNMKPIELLKDSYGKEMVLSELTRINHGIFV